MKNNLILKSSLFVLVFVAVLSLLVYIVNFRDMKLRADQKVIADEGGIAVPAVGSDTKPVSDVSVSDHSDSSQSAPVKAIAYCEFTSDFCRDFSDILRSAKAEFGDKISLVFRHYILDKNSTAFDFANASECAAEQGKFWEMHDQLFAAQKSGTLIPDNLTALAGNIGLDAVKFDTCQKELKYAKKIEQDMKEAVDSGIMGAPTAYIGGVLVTGARPLDDFTDTDGNKVEGLRSIINKQISK